MKIPAQYFLLLKKIWTNQKSIFILYVLMMVVENMLPILMSYTQKLFVNALEAGNGFTAVHIAVSLLFAYISVKFIKSIYPYVSSYVAHKFIFRTNFVFNKFLKLALYREKQNRFYEPEFNDLLIRVNKGHTLIPFQFFAINGIVISCAVLFFVQFPLIINYSPFLLIAVISNALFSAFFSKRIAKKQYEAEHNLAREQRASDYYGKVLADKSNAKEIRIFGSQDYFFSKWSELYQSLNRKRGNLQIRIQMVQTLNSLIAFILNNSVLIILFYQLYIQQIDLGTFIFLYTIVTAATDQAKDLAQASFGEIYNNYLHIQNYIDYTDLKSVRNYEPYIVNDTVNEKHVNEKTFESLELKNASFMYPKASDYAVKDISLRINKGEIISILGYNGSGKTTLSKMICGLLSPTYGKILLNGQNMSALRPEEVSSYFGIAYQDFTRYFLTAKDNIGFGFIERYSDTLIEDAFRKADGSGSLWNKLPHGLDTFLGKAFYAEGTDLSGGEWQKLALARSYMGNHAVLILDEPTASIDPVKEMEMLAHFRDILNDRTALLISHRIGFARLADRIVLMQNGRIEESGTHQELLRKSGLYSRMFHAQKQLYEETV
jgi:ABC-type multidrug transport system fused ATPase/permease subunit